MFKNTKRKLSGKEPPMTNITINTSQKLNTVSSILYGIFFEDINYAGDGGLYAELVANRSFEYYDRKDETDKRKMCWETVGDCHFTIETKFPISTAHKNYARISGKEREGLRNLGFCQEGLVVKNGQKFKFSCYTRNAAPMSLILRLVDQEGNCYCEKKLNLVRYGHSWTKYKCTLTATGDCKFAYLEVLLGKEGSVDLDLISLFPAETFCGRENGMRKDIGEILKDLSPKFMRFPGGCIVEGRSYENMYNWKETIGDVSRRRTNWNRWQMPDYQIGERNSDDYFQSYGIGYYEYFQFCEDIGAKPVPVMNVGMTCQWHEALLIDMDKLDPFIQDILDLIEFANGPVDSEWGKLRADMGHPEPFHLEYIGIGNEQWGDVYFERYEAFEKVLSAKHPEIKLITSAGWTSHGEHFDIAYRWMNENKEKAYAVDEHFYKSPQWFLDNIHRYDDYDRTLPKVFAGEYAVHTPDKTALRDNNWLAALCEAAFLTGVEKNADHVTMTCYAPLLARTGHNQWQPDLIWFDNDSVYGTPSYYIQKLFGENVGTALVETIIENDGICDWKKPAVLCPANDTAEAITATQGLEAVSTLSEDGKHLYVKLVNLADSSDEIALQLDTPATSYTAYELTAELDAANTHEQPENVSPVTIHMDFSGMADRELSITLKKHSVMVLDVTLA